MAPRLPAPPPRPGLEQPRRAAWLWTQTSARAGGDAPTLEGAGGLVWRGPRRTELRRLAWTSAPARGGHSCPPARLSAPQRPPCSTRWLHRSEPSPARALPPALGDAPCGPGPSCLSLRSPALSTQLHTPFSKPSSGPGRPCLHRGARSRLATPTMWPQPRLQPASHSRSCGLLNWPGCHLAAGQSLCPLQGPAHDTCSSQSPLWGLVLPSAQPRDHGHMSRAEPASGSQLLVRAKPEPPALASRRGRPVRWNREARRAAAWGSSEP